MKISMYIQWFDRKPDFLPDYDREHHGTITGNTPEECMKQYRQWLESHDLYRFTRPEILYIF